MNNDLQACMAILCPRYRGMLAILLVIGSCAGGIVYLENSLLQALVQEISLESDCQRSPIAVLLLRLVGPSTVPFLFLAAIFFAALVRALLSEKKTVLSLGMFARSRDDLEKVILSQLMHGDDDFYSNHSLAEIINRLEVDVTRVVDRRLTLVDCWWALAMVASNMLFFVLTDWRMAIVVAILCITGALYTHQVSKPIQQADKEYFYSNDQVKKDFEDYLQAVPEIQVGALFDSILSRFDFPQQKRLKAFMDWIIANARVLFAQIIWPVTALLLSVLIIFLGRHLQILAYSSNVSVVPVLIFALPTLFDNLTKLFALRIGYQLAANSMKRLQEYELRQERQWRAGGVIFDYCEGEADVAIEVEAATFQYRTKGGERHGGVSEVTASFRAGSWTAVVGAAGSGKSTMINMLLGRQPAQSGIVRYRMGRRDVPAEGNVLASFCTLMPQKPVIFDATIRENLLLGRRTPLAPHHFTAREMEHLEKIGLAAICRQKAMEMRPLATGRQLGEEWLAVLRQKARQAATELRVALMPFEGGGVDPAAPAWDAMLGGRTDAEAVIGLLLGRECSGLVRKLAASGLAPPLIERGRLVIDRSRNLLQLDSYSDFCDLAHHKLYRQVWELRRRCLAGQMASPSSQGEQLFFLVGLTSMPKEWSDCAADICNLFEELRKFGGEIEQLRKLVRPHWQDFDCREIHPYLCWRDNLLFGAALFANHRLRREMDARITDLLAQGPWGDFFVEQGMEFEAGHNGSRFSGGQRQLIALGRALFRDTRVLVLDEPTSALDPASRERVRRFLQEEWRQERIIITVSHDPEFVRHADEIHVMNQGRMVSCGSFDFLRRNCHVFKEIFQLEQVPPR